MGALDVYAKSTVEASGFFPGMTRDDWDHWIYGYPPIPPPPRNHVGWRPFDKILHPLKQTWNLKMDPWKRRFLLETIISRFHVNFWGCISWVWTGGIVGWWPLDSHDHTTLMVQKSDEKSTTFWMVLKPVVKNGINYRSLNWWRQDFWTLNSIGWIKQYKCMVVLSELTIKNALYGLVR